MWQKLAAVVLTAFMVVGITGCPKSLPKPDVGTVAGQQTLVGEAAFTYGLVMHDANAYIDGCKIVPKPVGCNDRLIAQIKVASDKAWKAIQSAESAVQNMSTVGTGGADLAIADAQAALKFLQEFTGQVPKK